MTAAQSMFWMLDFPAMLTGTLAALCCGLLGNMLVLRRMSLMGDAISHAVLPGLVIAFMVTEMRTSLPMFIGAAIAGVVTVIVVETVRRFGRVESGAAMGVVFSILFALGVVLIEQAARQVDLDAQCVLQGSLEFVFILPERLPEGGERIALPRQLWAVGAVTVVTIVFIIVFFKELRITAFDPALATSLGFRSGVVHYAYMIFVAVAVVASFEAVGSILVIAMLICPAATARLLTDRLWLQFLLSGIIAVATGVCGYLFGPLAETTLGAPGALNAAGMMTVVAGVFLTLAIILAPAHGLIAQRWRRVHLAMRVMLEDILGMLYRASEIDPTSAVTSADVRRIRGGGPVYHLAMHAGRRRGLIHEEGERLRLSEAGRTRAASIVRSHRLWENYLVEQLGLRADHVHDTAMELEHVTSRQMQEELASAAPAERDPHDKPIPNPDREQRDASND